MKRFTILDSHTGGEPTRLVLDGGPDLGTGPLDKRVARFQKNFDRYRSAIVNEPRGSDVMVGALLVPPHRAGCDLGVIFLYQCSRKTGRNSNRRNGTKPDPNRMSTREFFGDISPCW